MITRDLGTMEYRAARAEQEQVHAAVVGGGEEHLLLVEHPPVITLGRRPGVSRNLVASEEQLNRMGVALVQSDRGGDITFHGPGQVVIYPIVRLADHRLSVGGYVHLLERAVITALGQWGISARADPAAVGVWAGPHDAKVCAIGVRVRKGVTLHGLALNITTDLRYFNLIIPCGLTGRAVTSLHTLLGPETPPIQQVKQTLSTTLINTLSQTRQLTTDS